MRTHACATRWMEWLPPLFTYEASSRPNEVALIYDSPRHLCSVLRGAIEGAAERYGEHVRVIERSCMKRGATVCRFQARLLLLHLHRKRISRPQSKWPVKKLKKN